MSRFVRASKYRHVFGQPAKREHCIDNVKVTNSAWDTNFISASAQYISINWNASGGGAFAILPLPSPFSAISTTAGRGGAFPYKLPDTLPLARSHTAAVLDTDWSPHADEIVASGGEDGKVMIWKVESQMFEGWMEEGWEAPRDLDPVARIDASPKKIGQVVWHPTAQHVLTSASGEHVVRIWDLGGGDGEVRTQLGGHGDVIQSLAFNATGTVLATTCRDRKIRLFDVRAGGEPVRIADGHTGVKGSRVVWVGEMDRIATTGFSKMSDRQVAIWETGSLGNLKTMTLDQSSGVVMPFWSDNNILFLAGKGDGNIRYYEYDSDSLHALSEHKSTDPQRGMCFLPRRALSVSDCEIARAYKVHGSVIEPIAFIVPRKADSFQSDIFPPAPSSEPSLTAAEFFSGKPVQRKLVTLDTGSIIHAFATPQPQASSAGLSTPPVKQPTRAYTAPEPIPEAETIPLPVPVARSQSSGPTPSASSDVMMEPVPVPEMEHGRGVIGTGGSGGGKVSLLSSSHEAASGAGGGHHPARERELKEENVRLTNELRDAREKIRNLELQVEGMKANARKAAQALLDAS
ncbi:hypothetical protein AMATHDRAFT_64943 [Amanita thiersii Skay4041]|uniref:Coronin n=1 Tax=Amanita thiersii Skay4041 TaxID=703135 RepID=A0A2A9NH51_9AGAR|nr:hypothetical protein AMATHDRAFT_64943 [Amanita thiersii Skay4041]